MPITVRFFSSLRAAAGTKSVELDATTVREVEKTLQSRFRDNPKFLAILAGSNAILNGDNVLFLHGPRTRLRDGDELAFFPPIGGG